MAIQAKVCSTSEETGGGALFLCFSIPRSATRSDDTINRCRVCLMFSGWLFETTHFFGGGLKVKEQATQPVKFLVPTKIQLVKRFSYPTSSVDSRRIAPPSARRTHLIQFSRAPPLGTEVPPHNRLLRRKGRSMSSNQPPHTYQSQSTAEEVLLWYGTAIYTRREECICTTIVSYFVLLNPTECPPETEDKMPSSVTVGCTVIMHFVCNK